MRIWTWGRGLALATIFVLGATLARAEDRALIIGIETYRPGVRPALGAAADADAMRDFLLKKLNFPAARIRVLKNGEATEAAIRAAFLELSQKSRAGDRVFVYYSGHGSNLADDDVPREEKDGWDETIVAFDAGNGGKGQIRDDQFARWVAELTGRQITMIFDSCHSGTISRGFGVADAEKGSRYLPPDEATVREAPDHKETLTRDFKLVSDGLIAEQRISRQADLVVISAAHQDQKAFAMDVGADQWRGALTLSMLRAYEKEMPTLKTLERIVKADIREMQLKKRLIGNQVPQFEFNASRQADEPLFGAWERLPEIALINPSTKITVSFGTKESGKKPNEKGHLVYYEREKISYRITPNAEGYLYLMAFSRKPGTGERYVTMLYPNEKENLNNRITSKGLDLPENASYDIEPSGLDVIVALVTTMPLKFTIKEEYTWDEMFQLLNLKELQEQVATTRSIKVTAGKFDWQAATLPIYTSKR
ncbi:MAG: caspase family protein [Blastocatellia bacterium]|nr:caspase family protein [Blastocatellia bacterium]